MKNLSGSARVVTQLLMVLVCASRGVFSQQKIHVGSMDSLARFQAIPNDLAFDLLGLPGNNVQQPGTMSKLLASIQPVMDSKGSISPGIAISIAPYQLLEGDRTDLRDYVNSSAVRMLSNMQISLGSAPSKGADSSQDWGIGLRINIFNTGDGRLNKDHIDQLVQSAKDIFQVTQFQQGQPLTLEGANLKRRIDRKIVVVQNAWKESTIDTILIREALGTLTVMADTLRMSKDTTGAERLISFVNGNKNKLSPEIVAAQSLKNTISVKGDTSSWNTTSLDVSIGTVYRASQSRLTQSSFDRVRVWLEGGRGFGSSQLLGQLGLYHQYKNNARNDSTFATVAVMYRYGNQDFRVGFGGNGRNLDSGTLSLVAEIRVSSTAWIVASFNRTVAKGSGPTWTPGITLKTSGAGFGL